MAIDVLDLKIEMNEIKSAAKDKLEQVKVLEGEAAGLMQAYSILSKAFDEKIKLARGE